MAALMNGEAATDYPPERDESQSPADYGEQIMANADMVYEEEQLASLNRHVVEITERIHEQELWVEHLEWTGGDAALARELLSLSLDLLSITQLHRSLILARLGRSIPNKVN